MVVYRTEQGNNLLGLGEVKHTINTPTDIAILVNKTIIKIIITIDFIRKQKQNLFL
jgi:hypothetical protein